MPRSCDAAGCSKRPTHGTPGSKKSEMCAAHALEGMVDVTNKRCAHPDCSTQPSYGMPGSKKREMCAAHALEGMVDRNGRVAGSMAQVARSAARAGARGAKRALQDPHGGGGQRRRRATVNETMEALPQVSGIPLLTVGGFMPNMPVIPGGGGTGAAVVAAGNRGARQTRRPKKAKKPRRIGVAEVFMSLGTVDTSQPLTENLPAPATRGRNEACNPARMALQLRSHQLPPASATTVRAGGGI